MSGRLFPSPFHRVSLFSLSLLLLSTITTNGNPLCRPTDCGEIHGIHYPFWVVHDPPATIPFSSCCGYQDLKITCKGDTPMLSLSGHDYKVTSIEYETNTINLTDSDVLGPHGFPWSFHNLTLGPDSLLNYTTEDTTLTFCFNCKDGPPDIWIPCPEDWGSIRAEVPVLNAVLQEMLSVRHKLTAVLDDVLQNGFQLQWRHESSHYCAACEKSGGYCGYSITSGSSWPFICIPGDDQHESEDYNHECTTVPYSCGGLHLNVSYPFLIDHRPGYCGHPDFLLSCINDNTTLMITINGTGYQVKDIDYPNELLTVVDTNFVGQTCPHTYHNTTLDPSLFRLSGHDLNLSLYFNCTSLLDIPTLYDIACLAAIFGKHSYYRLDNQSFPDFVGPCFSTALVPLDRYAAEQLWNVGANLTAALQQGFSLNWIPGSDWCSGCTNSGGICGYNSTSPPEHTCFCSNFTGTDSCNSPGNHNDNGKKIAIGVSAAVGGFILACVLCLLVFRHKKRQERITSSALMRSASSEPPSRKDPELGNPNYQTHLFSYQELQEATNCFDASKELGDGGYGTVYKGKLRDGRIVAVKRLYENNYRRVEQFMNEIEILSRLRHKNLVTLYGCTSHQSRELLLVYEFVPNGTVADHLHGSRASEGGLTWPIRLSIAIETADSLSYLHAVEPPIIHRDVKTNNILLDGSFHVKVADFGLSRLFPIDATHVSTAPQGTPGYLDPEYHQCFQLTDKSDVYSFGVVLIELISSKPAVDITRHRHEINLATMAINKIQNCELEELVDPGLGYESDSEVRRMITQVAELAFRCLQWDKDMRPPMKEALEVLREIESGGLKVEETLDADALMQGDVTLMKKSSPLLSPDSVTERWASRSTTPNNSG